MYTLSSLFPPLLLKIHSLGFYPHRSLKPLLSKLASDFHFPNPMVLSVLILCDLSATFAVVDCSLLEIPPSLGFYNIILLIFLLSPWLLLLLSLLYQMIFSIYLLNVWGPQDSGLRQFLYLKPTPWGISFSLLVLNTICILIDSKCIALVQNGFYTCLSSCLLDTFTSHI